MLSTIGWIGSILLSFCAVPEAYKSWRQRECFLGWGFLGMWGIGELMLFIYVLPSLDYPLLLNYALNILCIGIMCFYKISR